jgi:hypothetical protein
VHQGALQLNGLDICLFLSKTRDLLDGETLRGLLFYYTACNLRHIHGSSWIHLMLMSTTAFLPTVWLFLQRFVAYTGNNMRKASPSPDPRERNKEVGDFCFCFHRRPRLCLFRIRFNSAIHDTVVLGIILAKNHSFLLLVCNRRHLGWFSWQLLKIYILHSLSYCVRNRKLSIIQ